MGQPRVTEQGIIERQKKLAEMQEEIRYYEGIQAEAGKDLWTKFLGPAVKKSRALNEARKKAIEEGQTDHPEKDFANIKTLAGAVQAFDFVVNAVENTQALIESRRQVMERIKTEIDQARMNLGYAKTS